MKKSFVLILFCISGSMGATSAAWLVTFKHKIKHSLDSQCKSAKGKVGLKGAKINVNELCKVAAPIAEFMGAAIAAWLVKSAAVGLNAAYKEDVPGHKLQAFKDGFDESVKLASWDEIKGVFKKSFKGKKVFKCNGDVCTTDDTAAADAFDDVFYQAYVNTPADQIPNTAEASKANALANGAIKNTMNTEGVSEYGVVDPVGTARAIGVNTSDPVQLGYMPMEGDITNLAGGPDVVEEAQDATEGGSSVGGVSISAAKRTELISDLQTKLNKAEFDRSSDLATEVITKLESGDGVNLTNSNGNDYHVSLDDDGNLDWGDGHEDGFDPMSDLGAV